MSLFASWVDVTTLDVVDFDKHKKSTFLDDHALSTHLNMNMYMYMYMQDLNNHHVHVYNVFLQN